MSATATPAHRLPTIQRVVDSRLVDPKDPFAGLDRILDTDVHVAHVARPLSLDAELDGWLAARGDQSWEWKGDPETLQGETLAALVEPLPPDARARVSFDLPRLATRMARYTHRKHIQVRFDVVRNDACRKFHQDYIAMRLLVTYVGKGTEWVAEADVDRSFLGRHDMSPSESNALIVPDPAAIRRADAGDVLLLKGAAHPHCAHRGAVHRSPPIEAERGRPRLVLRIDVSSCAC